MQINNSHLNQNFCMSYKIHTKDSEQADKLDLILSTNYYVERKPDSKKMTIMSRRQYNDFKKLAEDISSTIYPQSTYNESIVDSSIEWERKKMQNKVLEQILDNDKKKSIDIKI